MSTAAPTKYVLQPMEARRWRSRALIVGIVMLIASCIGGIFNPREFFGSYLFGYLFWIGLTLGSMALVMTQYLTGGAWGTMSRRVSEAASRTIPLDAVLFIPIIIGIPYLYTWAHPELVRVDDVLRHRSSYMNPTMFVIRAVIYFIIWGTIIYFLNRWSRAEDDNGGQRTRLERLSAPGLILYVFTVSLSSVDWAESLANHWYSTIWGFLFVASQGLTAMAFAILVLAVLSTMEPMSGLLRPSHFQDLGKLLLMFIMLWAYFAFSQLLIVWSGNLSSEIPWYYPRFATTWAGVGISLAALQFGLPFFLLLSRGLKRSPWALSSVVGIVLVMRFVDLYWETMPALHKSAVALHWLNFTTPVALGGFWMAGFLWQLEKLPLIPLKSPNLERALHHGEQ